MRKEHMAVIALLGFSSFYLHANAQDINFPGETERPSRYPLNPNNNNNGQPNNPNGGVSQQQYNDCVDKCQFTSEYNPVCGSDGVTYQNIGALRCAVNCGNPVRNVGRAPCTTTTASPTTPTTPTTPRPNNGQNFQEGVTLQQYNDCVDNCRFTMEYNPVCGSDGVTYQNIGAMACAVNCGNRIQNLGRAPCNA